MQNEDKIALEAQAPQGALMNSTEQPVIAPELAVTPPQVTEKGSQKIDNAYAQSLRGVIIKVLLGSVVLAAAVTVILILVGTWGSTTWRAIGTIVLAVVHLVVVLGVAASSVKATDTRVMRSSNVLLNVTLGIIVASFFVSTLRVWDVMTGSDLWHWYLAFFVVLFAAFHAKLLYDRSSIIPTLRKLVDVNYGVIGFVALLLIFWVFFPSLNDGFNGFYGRLVAAAVVIDVTLTIVIAVMQHMYFQRNPQSPLKHQGSMSGASIAVLIFFIYMLIYIAPILLASLFV
jgi:hypothetical protein